MAINQSFSFLITSTDKHVFLHQNYDPYEVFQENMDDINKKQAVTPLCKPLVKFDWSICPSCHINFHNVSSSFIPHSMNATLVSLAKRNGAKAARDRSAVRTLGGIGSDTIRSRRPARGSNAGRRYFSAVAIQRAWHHHTAALYGKAILYAMKALGLPGSPALVYAAIATNNAPPTSPMTSQDALDALYLPGNLFESDPIMDARWLATVTTPF